MVAVACALAATLTACGENELPCARGTDLLLINGKILSVDADESEATVMVIRNGRIAEVGDSPGVIAPCVETIDLEGRTVVPGLIDAHTHFLRNGQAPGHFIQAIETSFTLPDLLAAMSAQAAGVPQGKFLTVIGGAVGAQFDESRLPNLTELDAAVPDHPIYIQQGFGGPAVTNTRGKVHFEAREIEVWDDGTIHGAGVGEALGALIVDQTDDEKRDAAADWMAYAASVGLTTVQDQGCCGWFGAQIPPGHAPGYDIYYDLWREQKLDVRLRLRYLAGGMPDENGRYPASTRMENSVQGLGDPWMKVVGIGEFIAGAIGMAPNGALVEGAYRDAARRGWSVTQHSGSAAEHEAHIAALEAVAAEIPLDGLRWSLEHVFELTDDQIARLQAIGVWAGVQNQQYLKTGSGVVPGIDGPPFRSIVDSGIRASAGTDAAGVSPLNPWVSIYYMVTGKNAAGETVNDGQQISRLEALRLYTMGSAYQSFDEDHLGSIEPGKWADVVVLDADYLEVPDAELRHLTSVLTIIGGRVVHADPPFEGLAGTRWSRPGTHAFTLALQSSRHP